MLGMSVNTLPLRLRLQDVTAKELVAADAPRAGGTVASQARPADAGTARSGINGTAPLFTALLNYRHSVPDPEVRASQRGWDSSAYTEQGVDELSSHADGG